MHLSFILLGIFCHKVMKMDYNKGNYYFIGTDMRPQQPENEVSNTTKYFYKRNLLLKLENPKISTFDKIKLIKEKEEEEETNPLLFSYKINFEF